MKFRMAILAYSGTHLRELRPYRDWFLPNLAGIIHPVRQLFSHDQRLSTLTARGAYLLKIIQWLSEKQAGK